MKASNNSKYTFLTPKEAAVILKVSSTTLYKLIKNDKTFPVIKVSSKKYVIIEEKLPEWANKKIEQKQ